MTRITTKEAAEKLKMTQLTVQVLMKQDRLPIGYAIQNPGSTRYHFVIYKELVESYVKSIEEGILWGNTVKS